QKKFVIKLFFSFSWSYGEDYGSTLLSDCEFVISFACIMLTFIIYIAIVISLYKKTRGVKTMRRNERQLLLQASILFLILTSLISLWHFYYLVLPDTVWTVVSINVYWIVYCGLNPLMYFVFSKSIRIAYLRFIGILPPKTQTTISFVAGPNSRH
ncbi:hypothetical protein OSTOST_05229, partial [Ostertagia ostertagi]